MNEFLELSPSITRRVDWNHIHKTVDAIAPGFGGTRAARPRTNANPSPEEVAEAFRGIRGQFEKALKPLRTQIHLSLWIMLPFLSLAVAGGALLAAYKSIAGGSIFAGAALVSLFALITRTWRLGRDQAILELVPSIYETMFRLSRTPEQYRVAFDALLEEIQVMRGVGRGKGDSRP